ncbi:hypothetical protein H2201_007875 [Coniosporium apollinis]|uniref:Choline transporter n=1 Tax=Coniosporium apollinis TaxID=61459 RepID=A0ABQ9NPH1_9PEZI|nr:hypothetical protein H2201_007875 [Coniosporium apollinis]
MEKKLEDQPAAPIYSVEDGVEVGQVINASGHVQELERNFSLLSVVAIYNGGPPGVIYELFAVSFFYWLIAAALAELASAIPSSAGVYHWASITAGPKWGKAAGWYAGWWNFLAWIFACASISVIVANLILAMWGLFHADYVPQRWHVFVVYIVVTWLACGTVLFFNRMLPAINTLGLYLTLGGFFITTLVCAIMPSTAGTGHASNEFVWRDWENQSGYTSDGLVFLMGMLNGAYAVGTPDCVSHLAEEVPRPRINIPKAIAAQMVTGLITAFCYLVAIFYSISDFDALLEQPYTIPLAEVYRQATTTRGGSLGLLLVIFLPLCCTLIGNYITAGRMLWTLARDQATPFPGLLSRVSPKWKNPFNATVACACITTVLGCIYVGSLTAFNAFVGSFVVLTTLSYLTAILPHLLTRRRYVMPGPFWMPVTVAYIVGGISCVYIIVFVVIYCFPYAMPFDAASMNYTCLITGGFTVFMTVWWLWKRTRGYTGPVILMQEERSLSVREERISVEKV